MNAEQVYVCARCLRIWDAASHAITCCGDVVRLAYICTECETQDDEVSMDAIYFADEHESADAARAEAEACCQDSA